MKEPVLSRVLLLKSLARMNTTCSRGCTPRGIDAVDFLDVADRVLLRDGSLDAGRVGGQADGGEFEPGDGFAAVLTVVGCRWGGGGVDFLGEADAVVFLHDLCLRAVAVGEGHVCV